MRSAFSLSSSTAVVASHGNGNPDEQARWIPVRPDAQPGPHSNLLCLLQLPSQVG